MGYRGEDLDLRTPQTWSATPADLASAAPGETLRGRSGLQGVAFRGGPIWVDDTVLACCNHAYDVALAHRAGEVRLEHVLHAMTRIDQAAEALEARGVRVTALRRDSATVIASEIPVGLGNGKGVPRRSDEFEDVLRLAQANASRRSAPVSVDDVLNVFLDVAPDLPGLQLIHRNMPGRLAGAYSEAVPTMARNPYGYDPLEASRDRLRGYGQGDPMRLTRPDLGYGSADQMQNSRLDNLEQMVRSLSGELQSERKAFSAVLNDIQRELMSQRDEGSRLGGGIQDRLQAVLGDRMQKLEQAVMTARSTTPGDAGPLLDRIAVLERSLQSALADGQRAVQALGERVAAVQGATGRVDLAPLTSRLDIIEEAVLSRDGGTSPDLSPQLAKLESQLASQARDTIAAIVGPLNERIAALESSLEKQQDQVASVMTAVTKRLDTNDSLLGEAVRKTQEAQGAYGQELNEVHEALMKLNANQHTLAGSVEDWRRDSTGVIGGLGERLASVSAVVSGMGSKMDAVEQASQKPLQLIEQLSGTVDNMHKVTVERYYRRNRFWYWLFGSDDWVGASWPSQAARIIEDLKAVKRPRTS